MSRPQRTSTSIDDQLERGRRGLKTWRTEGLWDRNKKSQNFAFFLLKKSTQPPETTLSGVFRISFKQLCTLSLSPSLSYCLSLRFSLFSVFLSLSLYLSLSINISLSFSLAPNHYLLCVGVGVCVCVCLCMCMCVCMCVCLCVRCGGRVEGSPGGGVWYERTV